MTAAYILVCAHTGEHQENSGYGGRNKHTWTKVASLLLVAALRWGHTRCAAGSFRAPFFSKLIELLQVRP